MMENIFEREEAREPLPVQTIYRAVCPTCFTHKESTNKALIDEFARIHNCRTPNSYRKES